MNYSESGYLGYLKAKEKINNCSRNRHLEALEKYQKSPKHCSGCGKLIPYEHRRNKFCNHSCCAKHSKFGRIIENNEIRMCKCCGEQVDRRNNWYCLKCAKANKNKHIIDFNDLLTDSSRKRRILKEVERKCSICGLTEWMGKEIPLVMDHIDGNSDNNNRENLRLVCGNCDMQLPTYKGKNKGNGRIWRRQKYHQEKLLSHNSSDGRTSDL